MKNTGFIINVEADGSVIIPEEIREIMGWLSGNSVELNVTEDNCLSVKLDPNGCVLCGTLLVLSEDATTKICSACLTHVKHVTATNDGVIFYYFC